MTTATIATHEPGHVHQFTRLLSELLSQHGLDLCETQDAAIVSTSAPPLDIQKLLLVLGQRINPSVHVSQDAIQTQAPPPYPPLEKITKPNLTTAELAYYSNMAEQTWRVKACYDTAPADLRPRRICGKLAWPTAGAKKLLLGVTA